ncbi:XkdX family protein [Loigolactobacillus rennini]|nr:XkdX family protein [Loigolactobacillus rennini]
MAYILDFYQRNIFTDDDMSLFVKTDMITQAQYDSVKAA